MVRGGGQSKAVRGGGQSKVVREHYEENYLVVDRSADGLLTNFLFECLCRLRILSSRF